MYDCIYVLAILNLILGLSFFAFFNLNIRNSYDSNPFGKEIASDKYFYFNDKNATIECNEIKNDIMIKNKTLSEICPINPKVFIGILKAIKWMTLIIFICNFFMYKRKVSFKKYKFV